MSETPTISNRQARQLKWGLAAGIVLGVLLIVAAIHSRNYFVVGLSLILIAAVAGPAFALLSLHRRPEGD